MRPDYGKGAYRRAIELVAHERGGHGEVVGELEDDFHHFGVRLEFDRQTVTAIEGADIRVPWTTCPGALAPLRGLQGATLTPSFRDALALCDAREQCTHLYDVACLALCHAARVASGDGAKVRRYDFVLHDPDPHGRARAVLTQDGERRFDLFMRGMRIEEGWPEAFAGTSISGTSFARAVAESMGAEQHEGALVLRRALFIGIGRRYDFDRMERAEIFAEVVGVGACHTFAAGRVTEAERIVGSVREFADGRSAPLDGRDGGFRRGR